MQQRGHNIAHSEIYGFSMSQYHGQIWSDFGAFGEVLAIDLTRCHTEITRNADLWDFSVTSGEIFSQNLTKCPKFDLITGKGRVCFQRILT